VLPKVTDWSPADKLQSEFEAVGFYLSAHPLDAYAKSLKRLGVLKGAEIPKHLQSGGRSRVLVAGNVLSKQERTSAKGSRYAFLTLSDAGGTFEVTLFSEILAVSRELLESGQPLLLTVDAKLEDEQLRLTCQKIEELDKASAQAGQTLRVVVGENGPVQTIADILSREPRGKSRIILVPQLGSREVEIELKDRYTLSGKALNALRGLQGIVNIEEV
jgi:DNA polymerase-3 subunit alpha